MTGVKGSRVEETDKTVGKKGQKVAEMSWKNPVKGHFCFTVNNYNYKFDLALLYRN